MIKKMTILILIGFFMSCSNNDDETNDVFEINGEFKHTISGCDNTNNLGIGTNCTEFINFIDETNVSALIDGSDIAFIGNYKITDNIIQIESTNGLNQNISFLIQDENTLKRTESDDIWTKVE